MQVCRLTASDLACQRGERLLFSRLSLTLQAGEACQITGPNGIGKSSLIRILAGLLLPSAGSRGLVGTLGLIDERPALDPQLPLGKALAFWQRLDGATASSVERLGLANLLEVPVRYLSTGQKKRAALARLIGQDAGVWLLDEPLNGLDSDAARLVETLAGEHCRAGGICLIASHQPFALAGMQQIALADFASEMPLPVKGGVGVGPVQHAHRLIDSPLPPSPSPKGEGEQ